MTTERINHRAHDHLNTKADRAKCRREMAKFRKVIAEDVAAARITVGTRVLVHLDDADRDFDGTVLEIQPFGSGIRYYVQLDNRLCVFSHPLRTRKA